jgi:flagellar basal-body rod protein FlgB
LQFEHQLDGFLQGSSPLELNKTHTQHRIMGQAEGDQPIFGAIEQGEVEFDAYSLPDQKGNSVDMDHENAKLAENQLLYRSLVAAYNKRTWYSTILETS